jgi:UDP-N-acetylglucosamine 2-epimerase
MIIIYNGSRADYSIAYWVNEALQKMGIDSKIIPENNKIHYERFCKKYMDYIVLIGDREEVVKMAIAATHYQIPIIHIGGGEVSLGSYDDTYRAMISQAASYHFVINKQARMRLISMGIAPDRIYMVGSPRIDYIHRLCFAEYTFASCPTGLFIYHPETKIKNGLGKIGIVYEALKETNCNYIIIYPNNDNHSVFIKGFLDEINDNNKFSVFSKLTYRQYLDVLFSVTKRKG